MITALYSVFSQIARVKIRKRKEYKSSFCEVERDFQLQIICNGDALLFKIIMGDL